MPAVSGLFPPSVSSTPCLSPPFRRRLALIPAVETTGVPDCCSDADLPSLDSFLFITVRSDSLARSIRATAHLTYVQTHNVNPYCLYRCCHKRDKPYKETNFLPSFAQCKRLCQGTLVSWPWLRPPPPPSIPCSESAEARHGNRRGITNPGIPDCGPFNE